MFVFHVVTIAYSAIIQIIVNSVLVAIHKIKMDSAN